MSGDVTDRSWIQAGAWRDWFTILLLYGPFESTATAVTIVVALLDRYADCDGVFVLECSGSLEVNGVKTLIEIVYNLLIEPIQLSSFVVLEFGVSPVRLEQPGSER